MNRRSRCVVSLLLLLASLAAGACKRDDDRDDGDEAPSGGSPSSSGSGSETPTKKKWTFDDGTSLPQGLVTGLGEWKVEADPGAPSGSNVLRQKAKLAGSAFPLLFVDGLSLADVTVRVRCKPEAGSEDRACGLVFRLKDKDNYFITRANALEGNIRFYKVVNGARIQLASATQNVVGGAWHVYEAKAIGETITISWDGAQVLEASDKTFDRGSVGVWTKADSITAFDDLEVDGR